MKKIIYRYKYDHIIYSIEVDHDDRLCKDVMKEDEDSRISQLYLEIYGAKAIQKFDFEYPDMRFDEANARLKLSFLLESKG
jgi:hypothetical protein